MTIPARFSKPVQDLVERLAVGDFSTLKADGRLGRVTVDGLKARIAQYGRTIVSLPAGALKKASAYAVTTRPGTWTVDVPVWTREEGESDLTLTLDVIEEGSTIRVSISDLRVQ